VFARRLIMKSRVPKMRSSIVMLSACVLGATGEISARDSILSNRPCVEIAEVTERTPIIVNLAQNEPNGQRPYTGENVMSGKERYEFIEMNCPHLAEFQKLLKIEFLKNPHMGQFEELVVPFSKNNIEDIKKFLQCFDGLEEGKEQDLSEREELDYINTKIPFLWASHLDYGEVKIKVYLQIYIKFKNDELRSVNIMTNY
jgi:hypothetical protein